MEWKSYFNNVVKGTVGAMALTILLTAILSLIMMFKEISGPVFSGIYVGITSLSLVFGTILAARLHGEKGWFVGLAVGVLFYIALYGVGILFGSEATLGLYDLMKFALSIFVGLLSGMLGINLGRN